MFLEFPKWLHFKDEESVYVEDAKQEAKALKARAEHDENAEPAKRKYTKKVIE